MERLFQICSPIIGNMIYKLKIFSKKWMKFTFFRYVINKLVENLENPFEYGYHIQTCYILYCRIKLSHFVRYIPV